MDQYFTRRHGQTSNIFRVKIRDLSSNNGVGKTGMAFGDAGLIISTICDNEVAAVAYTQAGGTIEAVTTNGTFAAPTATKIRFKEVDATNHPGLYEIQIADARMAVVGAKALTLTIVALADSEQTDVQIDLTSANNAPFTDAGMISGDATAADNLESGYDGTGWNAALQGGTLTVTNQTTVVLSAGSADDDAYNGCPMVIQDAATAAQKSVVLITDYVGSTRTATITTPKFTIASTDKFTVLNASGLTGSALAGATGTLTLNGPTLGPSTGTIAFTAS